MAQLHTEMVTRQKFEELEDRVHVLEQNVASADNPDVKFFQKELHRLDPDQRSYI